MNAVFLEELKFFFCRFSQAQEEYRLIKYRKQAHWAVGVLQRLYIQWKVRPLLLFMKYSGH